MKTSSAQVDLTDAVCCAGVGGGVGVGQVGEHEPGHEDGAGLREGVQLCPQAGAQHHRRLSVQLLVPGDGDRGVAGHPAQQRRPRPGRVDGAVRRQRDRARQRVNHNLNIQNKTLIYVIINKI